MLWGTSWYTDCNKGQGMESPLRCEIITGFHFYGTFGSNFECKVETAFRKDILYFPQNSFQTRSRAKRHAGPKFVSISRERSFRFPVCNSGQTFLMVLVWSQFKQQSLEFFLEHLSFFKKTLLSIKVMTSQTLQGSLSFMASFCR